MTKRRAENESGRSRRSTERRKPTPRERQVLNLLAQGYEQAAIAEQLGIVINTVKTHVQHLYDKYETKLGFNGGDEDNEAVKLIIKGIPLGDIDIPPLLVDFDPEKAATMTPPERAVMDYMIENEGRTVIQRRIGAVIRKSHGTVKSHLGNAYEKLEARNKSHAVAKYMAAKRTGLLS